MTTLTGDQVASIVLITISDVKYEIRTRVINWLNGGHRSGLVDVHFTNASHYAKYTTDKSHNAVTTVEFNVQLDT